MRSVAALTLSCALAALAPMARPAKTRALAPLASLPEEVPAGATALPLTPMEARALVAFPGSVARYRADGALYLVRRAQGATRRLHGTAECLRAVGFRVTQLPPTEDAEHRVWASYAGTRDGEALRFDERIRCDDGETFPEVGMAFWHALVTRGNATCTAVTRVTTVPTQRREGP